MLSIGLIFWILYIVGLIFGIYSNRDGIGAWAGGSLFWWVLIALLGIGTFGGPIK